MSMCGDSSESNITLSLRAEILSNVNDLGSLHVKRESTNKDGVLATSEFVVVLILSFFSLIRIRLKTVVGRGYTHSVRSARRAPLV